MAYLVSFCLLTKYFFRLVEIPAYLVGMFAVDRLGRRFIINITLILGGLFCLLAGVVPQGKHRFIC